MTLYFAQFAVAIGFLQLVCYVEANPINLGPSDHQFQDINIMSDDLFSISKRGRCERVRIQMCMSMQYNETSMPNFFEHQSQDEAGLEVHQFYPLVNLKKPCSPYTQLFLCSMYLPICVDNYPKPIPPCRAVCESVRDGCAPLMEKYGFKWPTLMNCDRLPESNVHDHLCIDPLQNGSPFAASGAGKNGRGPTAPPIDYVDRVGHSEGKGIDPEPNNVAETNPIEKVGIKPGDDNAWETLVAEEDENKCVCKNPNVRVRETHQNFERFHVAGMLGCAMPCKTPYFSSDQLLFSKFWVGVWSVFVCFSTVATLLTYLIDMSRFRYPEQSIIYIALCYLMVAIGYIVRLAAGHEAVSCDRQLGIARLGTSDSALCTVVFLCIYLFGMASCVWWVILTLTWFLTAGLKWGNESVARYATWFHIIAWAIPSICSVIVLVVSAIDGDPIVGICYVGNSSIKMLYIFVIGPLLFYLLLGLGFLVAGFLSLCKVRQVVKDQGNRVDKLEQLMVRIGIFSVLYTVPQTIVIACYFHEAYYREIWELHSACRRFFAVPIGPTFAIFMLRHFMFLFVGAASGAWIVNRKTLDSWGQFMFRCCCRAFASPSIKDSPNSHQQYRYIPAPTGHAHLDIRSQPEGATSCGTTISTMKMQHPMTNHNVL